MLSIFNRSRCESVLKVPPQHGGFSVPVAYNNVASRLRVHFHPNKFHSLTKFAGNQTFVVSQSPRPPRPVTARPTICLLWEQRVKRPANMLQSAQKPKTKHRLVSQGFEVHPVSKTDGKSVTWSLHSARTVQIRSAFEASCYSGAKNKAIIWIKFI